MRDAVEHHWDELVAKAIACARERPHQRIVAIVAEHDAPEAVALRAAQPISERDPSASVAVVVTRESALDLLGKATPGLLDWIEDEGEGPRKRLPVIHAAARGMRTTAIEYNPAS